MVTSVLFVAGTRPEVIKLAPVVMQARARIPATSLLLTGQHGEFAAPALRDFGIDADEELDALRPGASLGQLTVRIASLVEPALDRHEPKVVVVQGDTTTAMIAGLLAFSRGVPVAHVEAGLRTRTFDNPYPEEANRRMIGAFATLHFPPTNSARSNLLAEGVPAESMLVTGNTSVDALEHVRVKLARTSAPKKQVLVTMHRRESWDSGIEEACGAIRRLAERRSGLCFLLPVHSNPVVKGKIESLLGGLPDVRLVEPLGYIALQQELALSWLVLTDSGGIQEEAPSYRVPVLVLRKTTERPEAVERGLARVIDTDAATIERSVEALLDKPAAWEAMRAEGNPFGDGQASGRIVRALEHLLAGRMERIAEIEAFA